MAATKAAKQVYVAKVNAVMESADGKHLYHAVAGRTRVQAGDPITKEPGFGAVFEPVEEHLHYNPKTPPAEGEVGE